MNKKNRGYLYLALLLGFLVLFYELRQVSTQALWQEIRQINGGWLLVGVGCMLAHWALEGKIIQGLLNRQYPQFAFRNAIRIPLIEHLFNAITPFSTGGQPAQLVALTKSGIDAGVAASVCLMKFVVYQVMIVVNFLLCLVFGFQQLSLEVTHLAYFVLAGFVINVAVVVGLLMIMYCYPLTTTVVKWGLKVVRKFISRAKGEQLTQLVQRKLTTFYQESQFMRTEKRLLIKTFALTFIQLLCYYIVPYFVLKALHVTGVRVAQVMMYHAFIILIISLFPVPSGSGGAEYSFRLLFGSLLLSQSKLVLAITLWRLITQFLGVFLGIGALFVQPTPYPTTEMGTVQKVKQRPPTTRKKDALL